MKHLIWIAAIALFLSPQSAMAQQETSLTNLPPVLTEPHYRSEGDRGNRIARSGFALLKISASARLAGMADANVGTSRDIHSIFQNAAGLVHIDNMAYLASYNEWLVGTKMGAAGFAYRIPIGVVGVAFRSFTYPDVEETTPLQPNGTGRNIKLGDFSVAASFAKQLTDKFSMGFRLRYVRSQIHIVNVSSTTFDVGTLFYTGFRSLRVGMTMSNLGGNKEVLTEDYRLPFYYNLAVAMELLGKQGDPLYLTTAYEHVFFRDYGERDHIGGELWIQNMLALRAGYKFRYDVETWSVGAGVNLNVSEERKISVDVSYSDIGGAIKERPLRLTLSGTF
ncbi:MAG: PorV/PorQ family protein [Gemmatimonadetes bacterium]|nr:PorV/PorQ family protein [Gemmatimonadota bacterium]MYF18463.1 PorV/PorQ family protein [Gemmatimonadota bacterium]